MRLALLPVYCSPVRDTDTEYNISIRKKWEYLEMC